MLTTAQKKFLYLKESILPFKIVVAKTDEQLQMVANTRFAAYGKHLPQLSSVLEKPDDADYSSSFASLLAVSKLDGSSLGTIRMQFANADAQEPLLLEGSYVLPNGVKKGVMCEASRLAVPQPYNSLSVRMMLMKACYWYARFYHSSSIFFCVREPVDRLYKRFDIAELTSPGECVKMKHIGGVPHKIYWFNILEIEKHWYESAHPFYELFVNTLHPDILNSIQQRVLFDESERDLEKCA